RLRKAQEPVERDRLGRQDRVRPRNGDGGARRIIVLVAERHTHRQPVRATPLEDRDDDVATAGVCLGENDLREPVGEERRRRNAGRASEELAARQLLVLLAAAVRVVKFIHRGAPGQYHWKALALRASEIVSRTRVSLN